MNILAIDSCSNVATAALIEDGKLVAEFVLNDKKTHSVKLLPAVEYLLSSADRSLADIELFAVTAGPGSFTGQRIGVATVKGLAFGRGGCCVGVSSLEAAVYNLPFYSGIISPIMDARRGQVYNALFRWEDGELIRLCEDRAIALDEVLQELKGEQAVFLGDGVPVHRQKLSFEIAPAHLQQLRGASVAACGMAHRDEAVDASVLLPLYLRKTQAEREYEEHDRHR